MTRDELADYLKAGMDEYHAHVDAMPDGPQKTRYIRRGKLLHAAMDAIKGDAVDDGLIQPFSGGDPKMP